MVSTGQYLELRRYNMALTLTGNIKIGGTVTLGGDGAVSAPGGNYLEFTPTTY